MADLEITVKYKSRVAKTALIGVVLLMPVWGILLPGLCIYCFFYMLLTPAFYSAVATHIIEVIGPVLGLLLITVLGIKTVLNLADNRIIISKLGIEFPFFLGHTFGLRRNFPWPSVRKAQFFDRPGKRELVIFNTDGFPVYMDVNCFAPEELEQLLVGLDVWAVNCEKDAALEALQDELQKKSDQKLLPSYTAMWDEELSRHFSSTAYVPLEPGHTLYQGKLNVVSQISFGGLSAVYLCQRDDRDLVILKEAVVPGNSEDEATSKAMELFRRESQILMKLDHPAIVKVYDHFVEANRHYLMIEYHNGQDLNQHVRQHGAQSERTVLNWALEILTILEYLHTQEPPIIHRDVTPDNLVLGADGAIVMIDFGAANEFLGKATGTLVGKQSFIAPEQFRGRAVVQSDLYALGCTLHFLLTAQEPVPLSVSHPAKINDAISPEVDSLVASLTAMELEQRIESAAEAKKIVQSALNSLKEPSYLTA